MLLIIQDPSRMSNFCLKCAGLKPQLFSSMRIFSRQQFKTNEKKGYTLALKYLEKVRLSVGLVYDFSQVLYKNLRCCKNICNDECKLYIFYIFALQLLFFVCFYFIALICFCVFNFCIGAFFKVLSSLLFLAKLEREMGKGY